MRSIEFEALWDNWVFNSDLFESRPGVFVKVGDKIDSDPDRKRLFGMMIKAGFIFEVKPKQYRVVQPRDKSHEHHFVCECGAEAGAT